MNVFVLSSDKKPLIPCHPARARQLMRAGRAAVFRHYPFTIILKDRVESGSVVKAARLKIDPGSKVTGMAVVNIESSRVVWAAELQHRGSVIRDSLRTRNSLRRTRRIRKTWYRAPRFKYRKRPEGWLAPSLDHRVETVMTWVERLRKFAPVKALSVEDVKFDMQKLQHPEILGFEYQHGELAGYEVREYLLEKWQRKCAYCGEINAPLQQDHIHPVGKGGSNRVSNLTLACKQCNQNKGSQDIAQFLADRPRVLARILRQAKSPLADAAAVNTVRRTLVNRLQATGLPLESGSASQTKMNRETNRLPKSHWIDAACVGSTGRTIVLSSTMTVLKIVSFGHGKRQRCRTNAHGVAIAHASRAKKYLGFQTGDHVVANIPKGKYAGTHIGRISIRHRPSFRLNGFDTHVKHIRRIQRADGYAYSFGATSMTDAQKIKL